MKLILGLLVLFTAFQASAGPDYNPNAEKISSLKFTIEKDQRFASGWYTKETQNMFTSYPYSKNWNGQISCGVNVQAPQATIDSQFNQGHDGQYFYTAKFSQILNKINFKSQANPYTYENCVEYSTDTAPEDTYCVRSETVYGTTSSFEFKFENKFIDASIACSKGGDMILTEADAIQIVQQMLNINVK